MGWFILACLCGGGLFGMSRAQLNRQQQLRNDALIDATYDAASSYDSDGGSYDCSCDTYSESNNGDDG